MKTNKVYIIGIGPGSKDYILPIAKRHIEKSDCLIAASRVMALFKNLNKEKKYLKCDFKKLISYIKANKDKKRIAVLVSGDPGLYSFLGQVSANFSKDEYEVIPGISAMQVAFAKIKETWQDAKIISLHARMPDDLAREVRNSQKAFLFTDSKFTPDKIARFLLDNKIENRRAVVFEELASENERITDTDLKKLSSIKGFGLCVMIIKK